MPSITGLKEELDEIQTLKYVTSAFTEASAAKIRSIKTTFEKNRTFYEAISHLYDLVQYNARLLPPDQSNQPTADTPPVPQKVLSIAVTSNQRFYGSINVNIMKFFLGDLEKNPTDMLVIGATGLDYMRNTGFSRPFESLQFAKDFPTRDEISSVLKKIKPYQSVFVYYPKFVTLITQTVAKTDITHRETGSKEISEEEIHIIFEPEIRSMVSFFEEQVRATLFIRVILETDLSRTAARLLSMTSAEEHASTQLQEKLAALRRARISRMNLEQLEQFSGMQVWKQKEE